MKLLTTGWLDMELTTKAATARRIHHRPSDYTQSDMLNIQKFDNTGIFEGDIAKCKMDYMETSSSYQ
eukprot:5690911-Pyramimonas_sp.AAC.1